MNICNVTHQIASRAPLPGFTGLKWPRLLDMLQISLLLAAFIGYLAIALALVKGVRDTKKGGHVWILYVEPRLPGDCEEG